MDVARQDSLFSGGRRRRGQSRQMIDRTLTAWRKDGQLAGDGYAATRSNLRDAAEAVDAARAALREGEGSPYTLSMTVRVLQDLLDRAGEGGAPTDDLDAALSALLRDAPQL